MTNEANFTSLKPYILSSLRIAKYSCFLKSKEGEKSVPILFKDPQF